MRFCAVSIRITSKPFWANTWAIPLPIVPAPKTAMDFMDSVDICQILSSFLRSPELKSHQDHNDLLHLDCQGDRIAATQTEGREALLQATIFQGVDQGRENARARGADGMTERDGSTVNIDAIPIPAEFATIGDGLGCKCFVSLDQVEVVDLDIHLLAQFADRVDRGVKQEF